jgi:hypothetical protein
MAPMSPTALPTAMSAIITGLLIPPLEGAGVFVVEAEASRLVGVVEEALEATDELLAALLVLVLVTTTAAAELCAEEITLDA